MRKMRIAVFGAAGVVASVCIDGLRKRGADIVAGIEIRKIGEDIGDVSGTGHLGVALTDEKDMEKVLDETKPDLALDCSLNTIPEIYHHAEACMERGINFMPVGVVCYDPFDTDPEMAAKLDEIGRRTGATYLGSGSAEVWQSLPMVVSALGNEVTEISLDFNALLNDFGAECLEGCRFGLEKEHWNELEDDIYPSAFYPVLRMLAVRAGLHITDYRQENDYAGAEEEINVPRLNVHIPKGTLCDYISRDIVSTKEGVTLTAQSHYKFGIPGETNSFTVCVKGKPEFRMTIDDFHGDSSTSIIMVNRIPDVVAAPGGVHLVNDLPVITYRGADSFLIQD